MNDVECGRSGQFLEIALQPVPVEVCSVQVTVPQTQYSTGLFVPVTLRCDYSTSASLQNVLVTWLFKSFCKDPVLDYYSTAYQAALQLGQDPSNDCPDSQRTIRTVAQKHGANEPSLGPEYSGRRITIQNKADLVISEVMWWDNGVYVCSVDAAGDTSGYPNKYISLVVYNWLTVLFLIFGGVLLIILLCVCCCQCCPQRCCCYVRCPCCPQTCCCPEKMVMQHRMMKEAQRAMNSWVHGQPVYAPLSSHSSGYPMNPMMYAGSASGKIPMSPMPLPPPAHLVPNPGPMPVSMSGPMLSTMPPPNMPGRNGGNKVLDYLENQVRDMDVINPMIPPPPVHMAHNVPFSAGPPSMLSGLNDGPASRRHHPAHSSGSSSYNRHRQPPSSRRGMTRSYSQEDVLDNRSQVTYRPRSRSREDLLEGGRGYYDSSSDDYGRRAGGSRDGAGGSRGGTRNGARGGAWPEHPPSYSEYEPGQKPPRRPERFSVRV
ncbi:Immunoglobulin-like domain-containing receptor 1 [Bagarius yarrelli]|nr:Immunoglobulin-like domain-containing receptor 1 [Bagarius yarrelli]